MDPKDIDDVIVGCAFPEGEQGMQIGRVLAVGAGLPEHVAGMTINRLCSSGVQAIADATAKISMGWSDVIIAGGVESMSHIPMGGSILRPNFDWPADLPWVYISMGLTAENIAANYKISREDMDAMGMESNRRAYEAIKAGKFKEEIIPINAYKYKIDKKGNCIRETFVFDTDDGVRWPVTLEDMAKLKSPFKAGGNVTAANSSQTTDGAAFALLMTSEKAKATGLKPMAKLTHHAVVGVQARRNGRRPEVCHSQGS
ncbi:MAG: thiolase family protein [Desulfobacterales bacterium]|nr:thiolase family protein [Desulfobacterales bacterium]